MMETDYPFEDIIRITVLARDDVDVALRIPSWPGRPTLSIGGRPPLAVARGEFHTVTCRAIAEACYFVLDIDAAIDIVPGWGESGGISVSRGPLVFALPLSESWVSTAQYAFSSQDWTVATNSTWNVGLVLDAPITLQRLGSGGLDSSAAYTAASPRMWLSAKARVVHGWTSPDGKTANSPPPSPACAAEGACGKEFDIALVPFGNTRLRIAVFPYV